MDSLFDADDTGAARRRRLAGLTALALYAVVLWPWLAIGANGSDSSGYMNLARLLREGRVAADFREAVPPGTPLPDSFTLVPLGFRPLPDGTGLVPTYPPGLPLLLAGLTPLAGPDGAAVFVALAHAVAGVWLTYRLARAAGTGRKNALLAAVIVAASPLFIFESLQTMSDVPSLVWVTATVLAAWRARERPAWALTAGFAGGFAVLLRPTNLLAVAPVLVLLGDRPRAWWPGLLGALPAAVFQLGLNQATYGAFMTTGYGDVTSAFAWTNVGPSLRHYAAWLPGLFTPVVIAAFFGRGWWRAHPRMALALGAWFLAFAIFYAFYYHTAEQWWYLRFLLPAAPALVVAGVAALEPWCARLPARLQRGLLGAALAAVALAGAGWFHHFRFQHYREVESVYRSASHWLADHAPANAVVVCMQVSGSLWHDTDRPILRWDIGDPDRLPPVLDAVQAAGRPVYAVLFPFEREDHRDPLQRGRWTQVAEIRHMTIWRREGP